MTEERKRDFDSCTRHELTECVRFRIKVIREIRLAKVEVAFKFPNVHTFLTLKEMQLQTEIKTLLKMRRVMKERNLHHWREAYDS